MRIRTVRSAALVAVILTAVSAPAYAQSGLSLLAGGTLSKVGATIPGSYGFQKSTDRVGVVAGIGFSRPLSGKLSFLGAALFHQAGSNLEFVDQSEIRIRTSYVNIPLLASIVASAKVSVLAGLDLALQLTNTEKSFQGGEQTGERPSDSRVLKNSLGMGLAFGAKVSLQKLALIGLYKWGLTDQSNQKNLFNDANVKLRWRSLCFLLSIPIGDR